MQPFSVVFCLTKISPSCKTQRKAKTVRIIHHYANISFFHHSKKLLVVSVLKCLTGCSLIHPFPVRYLPDHIPTTTYLIGAIWEKAALINKNWCLQVFASDCQFLIKSKEHHLRSHAKYTMQTRLWHIFQEENKRAAGYYSQNTLHKSSPGNELGKTWFKMLIK